MAEASTAELSFSLDSAKSWRAIVAAVAPLVEEGEFIYGPDGLKFTGMDSSHIAMVDLTISKSAFQNYICSGEGRHRINMINMVKLLGRAGEDEALTLNYSKEREKMQMILKGALTKQITVPTLQSTDETVPKPKLNHNTKMKLPSSLLRQIIEDCRMVSDCVRLTSNPDMVTVEAGEGELNQIKIEIPRGSMDDLEVSADSKAAYSLNYLVPMVKAAVGLAETAELKYSSNMPIQLDFNQLTYYLAPKVDWEGGESPAPATEKATVTEETTHERRVQKIEA